MEYIFLRSIAKYKDLKNRGLEGRRTISVSVVLTTAVCAFLLGRVVMLGDAFPCSIALIAVMMSVNTVNIYLVPILILSMMSFYNSQIYGWGDMGAVALCGLFFLFFKDVKFTTLQRAVIACTSAIICNCFYFILMNLTYLFNTQTMAKELVAIAVFVKIFQVVADRVWNEEAPRAEGRDLVKGAASPSDGQGMTLLCTLITGILVISGIGQTQMVIGLWIALVLVVQYRALDGEIKPARLANSAMTAGGEAAIVRSAMAAISIGAASVCVGMPDKPASLLLPLIMGMLSGELLAGMLPGEYRKPILAITMFGAFWVLGSPHLYIAAIVCVIYIAVPTKFFDAVINSARKRFLPEEQKEGEQQHALILEGLRRKKENFRSRGNLYGAAADSRQILSYQFLGMERVVDNIIRTMQGAGDQGEQSGKYSIATATTGYSIEGVSGDSGLCTVLADGRVAMILSDCMGKGAAASVESKLVVTTLAKLLDSGFDVDLAMKTINGMLLTKEQSEIFATVDLALINPTTARAKLFKMGAATTFVRHGDKVAIAKAPTLPLGILGALNLEYMDVKLRRGDMLVMVSDGVTDCDRRDPHADWLRDKLLAITSHDPDTIAELIINKAAEKYGLKERDDLTVLVAVVS